MSTSFMIKFLAIAGGLTTAGYQQDVKPCRAVIQHTKEDSLDTFQGMVYNNLDETLNGYYTLETVKEGQSGRSVSRQGGQFSIEGHSHKKLSKSSINLDPGSNWKVVLKVYSEKILLCCDSIEVFPRPGEN